MEVDGQRPWDLRVHDRRLFAQVLAGGSLALGEAYVAGQWDCDQLDEFFCRVLSARLDRRVGTSVRAAWLAAKSRLLNVQKGGRSYVVGERHYDLGDEFFRTMLDRRRTYSCAYWSRASTLDGSQEAKLDVVCGKIGLARGQRLLDIGCGWGSLAGYAAERYGAEVVGVQRADIRTLRGTHRGRQVKLRRRSTPQFRNRTDRCDSS